MQILSFFVSLLVCVSGSLFLFFVFRFSRMGVFCFLVCSFVLNEKAVVVACAG